MLEEVVAVHEALLRWLEVGAACLSAIISSVTLVAIYLAYKQLQLSQEQAATQFEDSLGREYRELAQKLPTKALLGEPLSDAEYAAAQDEFYHYIDLCNEQIFLRINNRIRLETWRNWCEGIQSNLERPAFAKAWEDIKTRASTSFSELRRLEEENFQTDPRQWVGDER